jgi:hypothetical protein
MSPGMPWPLITGAAWLPVGLLTVSDFHWLRADLINPTPEKGAAFAHVQLEGILRYQMTPNFSMGVGGRYWQIGTTSAEADFVGSQSQAITYRTERRGAFVQASYSFGDLPPPHRLSP